MNVLSTREKPSIAAELAYRLFRAFPPPPETMIFKEADGRAQSEYDDEVANPFFRYFRAGADMVIGKDVLDLGCGYGGRGVRFKELGARSVAGVEVGNHMVVSARDFARARGVDIDVQLGAGEELPFADETFDQIVMFDVLEHVVSVDDTFTECLRVLRPNGTLALVFPPFYDFGAGSHLHGYATSLTALHAILPHAALRQAARRKLEEDGIEVSRWFRDIPSDPLWNQNGLTVAGFHRAVKRSGFEIDHLHYLGQADRRLSQRTGPGRLARMPIYLAGEAMAALPVVRELCCSRICAILRKPDSSQPHGPG